MSSHTEPENQPRYLTPKELAAFVVIFRNTNGWTQETLAEISGLTTRTIQRVENAEMSSLDTRRALARALKLDDIDAFNKPHLFKSEEQMRKEAEEFRRLYVTLELTLAKTGKQVADLVEKANCYVFHQQDGVPREAAETVATLFDYMRDYGDADEFYSYSQKLQVQRDFEGYLEALKQAGISMCYATRKAYLVTRNWKNQTPFPVTIAYAIVAPKGEEPAHVSVLRSVDQIGF